jgi:phenol 2-monooxygenase
MTFLEKSDNSPVTRYTPANANIDSVIDIRAIFQQDHRDLKVEELPSLLLPRKGRFGLIDYEKAYTPDLKNGRQSSQSTIGCSSTSAATARNMPFPSST